MCVHIYVVSELDWSKSRMWQNHCKNHRKLCDVQSIEYLKSQQIPENNRVVELFDKIPVKQKSYQSAVNNKGFVIFCIVLPSIGRVPKASMKCEGIIVKYHQNDDGHSSRTLFEHAFWLVKIMQLWHFGSNTKIGKRQIHCKNQSKHDVARTPKWAQSEEFTAYSSKIICVFTPTSWFS